jgi:hypothetical protein
VPKSATRGEVRRTPLNMRTTQATRARLEATARANGRSLTEQVEHLIERSTEQEDLFGGPEGRRVVYEMGTAFLLGGQFSAGPDVPVKEWLRDTGACSSALASAVDALARTLPAFNNDDALRLLLQAIISRIESRGVSRRMEQNR